MLGKKVMRDIRMKVKMMISLIAMLYMMHSGMTRNLFTLFSCEGYRDEYDTLPVNCGIEITVYGCIGGGNSVDGDVLFVKE